MKKKKTFIMIISGSIILFVTIAMTILIAILMLLDFFGTKLTKEKVVHNAEYGDAYLEAINNYLEKGYVPLQRILYFHLEDEDLTIDTLYQMNRDSYSKNTEEISIVCKDERVKEMMACNEENLKENEEYLIVSSKHFNFPLDEVDYTVTSFFNQEREVYGEYNVHEGWDFAVPEKTPVYSVCSGTVYKVNFTQDKNVPYDKSGNAIGNTITIKCDEDYNDTYYVMFAHLYPNSAKVKKGDKVNHWTEVASVGTTGHSTGNHLHYQVQDKEWNLIDGMQLIDLTLINDTKPHYEKVLN